MWWEYVVGIYGGNMWWEYVVGICGGNMWEYVVGILFSGLNEGKKMQNCSRYPDANVNKFLMGI